MTLTVLHVLATTPDQVRRGHRDVSAPAPVPVAFARQDW
jgi:hypothetical protein